MKIWFFIFLCLILLSAPTAFALSTVDVSDQFVTTVEPEGVAYDPVVLLNQHDEGFWQPNRKSWGYGTQTIWLRGELENPVNQVLSLPYACPTQADFFVYDSRGQLLKTVHAGTFSPWEGRELKLNLVGIEVHYPTQGRITILIRQQSRSLLDTHYILRNAEDHRIVEWIYLAGYGIYFGLALALFFHNLSLYFSVRDRVYLAYLVFVVCLSVAMLFNSAYYSLFWYRLPQILHNLPYATPALLNVGAAFFACEYLHLNPRNSWLARAIVFWAAVSLVAVAAQWYRPDLATPWNPYLNLVMIVLTVSACTKRIMQGERYAWFLLAAVLSPFVCVIAYYLGNFLFKVSVPSDIISMAFALEMLLMSTGLAHRVYILRQRQHHMQTQQEHLIHHSKMRALSDMASGVAHEVNNPLMIIGGYAEVIRRLLEHDPIDLEKVRENTGRIDRNVNRIAFIVQALRSFAQDDQLFEREQVAMQEIIHQALALCSSRIMDRGIELRSESVPELLWVHAPRTPLVEVILSLLDNAMEALRNTSDKILLIELQRIPMESGDHVRVVIQDSGPGVPVELKNRLFQPFFTTRAVGDGAGLSLSRSLGVIQSMQGTLSYERRGEVTRFVVDLPLCDL